MRLPKNATHVALMPPTEETEGKWLAQAVNDHNEPVGPYALGETPTLVVCELELALAAMWAHQEGE